MLSVEISAIEEKFASLLSESTDWTASEVV
jgi:hypothetical protein